MPARKIALTFKSAPKPSLARPLRRGTGILPVIGCGARSRTGARFFLLPGEKVADGGGRGAHVLQVVGMGGLSLAQDHRTQ